MSIVNRRNAVIGWLAWNVGKQIAKQKARKALPAVDPKTKRPKRAAAAVVAVLVAAGGAVLFWRSRSGDDTSEQPD